MAVIWVSVGVLSKKNLSKGPPPLVLREGWDAVYQYLGRGERQTVVTQGGVEDE